MTIFNTTATYAPLPVAAPVLLPTTPPSNATGAEIEQFLAQVRESMLSVSESIETVNYKPFTIESSLKGENKNLAIFERNLELVWRSDNTAGLVLHFTKLFLEKHPSCFIAGGFPRTLLSENGFLQYKTHFNKNGGDIDLYFGDKEEMISALREIMVVYPPQHTFYGKSFAYSFTDGRTKLQLIYAGNTAEGQIKLFDLENVMFSFSKEKRWYNPRIFDLEQTKTLSLANMNKGMLGSYLGRIQKYINHKGYERIDTDRDMTFLAAAIVSDWKQGIESPYSLQIMLTNQKKIKWPNECLFLFTAIADPDLTRYIIEKLCNS